MTFQRALTLRQVREVYAALARGETKTQVAKNFGVSRRTIQRLTKEPEEKTISRSKPCGTNAGYQRHRKRGERCWLCSAAHAEEVRLWKLGQSPQKLRQKYAEDADEKSA